MDHENLPPAEFQGSRQRKLFDIDVAADDRYGSDSLELFENAAGADVAGVNDPVHSAQGVQRLGAHQPVGIGNDADRAGAPARTGASDRAATASAFHRAVAAPAPMNLRSTQRS